MNSEIYKTESNLPCPSSSYSYSQTSILKDEIYFALSLIKFETKEIFYVIIYASIIGVLSFSATLSIQFLINSISFTGQTYPIVMLSATTVILLLFISALQLIQKIAVEKLSSVCLLGLR
jgi:ABC-type bacteriocin/lantibiotic exporter with double-glycine peptidase domain